MKTQVSFLMNFMTVIAIAMMLFIVAVVIMAITTYNDPQKLDHKRRWI